MKINWIFVVASVVLLWFPGPFPATLKNVLRRNPAARWPAHLRGLAALKTNWIDLTRAALGAFLLAHAVTWNEQNPPDHDTLRWIVVAQGAVLAIGLIVQTIRWVQGVVMVAPLFYLSGLVLAFTDPFIGAVAVAMGWALGISFKKPELVLPFMVAFLVAGFAVTQWSLIGMVFCAVAAIPLLLMYLSGRSFVYLVKKASV
jgi:hypothetical protein